MVFPPRKGKHAKWFALVAGLALVGGAVAFFSRRGERAQHPARVEESTSTPGATAEKSREETSTTQGGKPASEGASDATRSDSSSDGTGKSVLAPASPKAIAPNANSTNVPARAGNSPNARPSSAGQSARGKSERSDRIRVDRPLDFARLAMGIRDKYALAAQSDPEADLALLRQRFEAGDSDAALALGLFLAYGDGFTPDPALAAVYFEKAANAGIARANAELGRLFLSGYGVSPNPAQAAEYFRAAWAAGDAEGAFLLAAANRMKLFPGADPAEAASLFAAAADRGHAAAQKAIYDLNKSGELKFASAEQLTAWITEAAATGDPDAMASLAREYAKSGRTAEAHALLERAAEAGSFGALEALMAMTKINPREPETYRNIVRLLEAHTADSEQAPAQAFLMLSFFQAMGATDAASQASALENLRSAATRGESHARLALQLAESGEPIASAIVAARKLSEADAYATWLQRRRENLPDDSPADAGPVPTKAVQPVYPRELAAERLGGSAVVEFVVGADGRVLSAHVVSATHPSFGIQAEEAIKQWIFKPAVRNGEPTSVKMKAPFIFRPPP